MKPIPPRQYVFGSLFLYANKLQVIGDRHDTYITMKQWLLIIVATQFDEPPTLTELADFMGCSRQNTKKLAMRLQEKDFLVLEKDHTDSRAWRVVLTEQCVSYYRQRESKENHFLELLFKGFTEDETQALYHSMNKLGKNIFEMYARTNGTEADFQTGGKDEQGFFYCSARGYA